MTKLPRETRRELVEKVFKSMPNTFTSTEFVEAMLESGANPKLYLYNHLDFLKNNCIRQSKKTWTKPSGTYSVTNPSLEVGDVLGESGTLDLFTVKRDEVKPLGINTTPDVTAQGTAKPINPNTHQIITSSDSTGMYMIRSTTAQGLEQEAIDFLKARGYKILKTTTVEV